MKYSVEFSEAALKDLKKMNKNVAATLFAWIKKNLDDIENPCAQGKALAAVLSWLWRYRVGGYRIIAQISDKKVTIVIIEISHRNNVYKKP